MWQMPTFLTQIIDLLILFPLLPFLTVNSDQYSSILIFMTCIQLPTLNLDFAFVNLCIALILVFTLIIALTIVLSLMPETLHFSLLI